MFVVFRYQVLISDLGFRNSDFVLRTKAVNLRVNIRAAKFEIRNRKSEILPNIYFKFNIGQS
jgi:hypothetical protein